MKRLNQCVCAAIILFSACTSPIKKGTESSNDSILIENVVKEIDIARNLKDCGEELLLSDFVEDVDYVKLETKDNGLIGDISNLKLSNNYIYIKNYGTHSNSLCRMFDRKGQFLRSLGVIGQGPGEMVGVNQFAANDSLIYMTSFYRYGFYVYNVHTNKFVTMISPEVKSLSESWDMTLLNNNIVTYPGLSPDNLYVSTACITFKDGKVLNQVPYLNSEFKSERPQMITLDKPRNWMYNKMSNVYSQLNDTIYGITSDSIFPRYHVLLGDYKLPVKLYDIQKGERENFILMMSVLETRESLLFHYYYDKKAWYSCYNKKDETIKSWAQSPKEVRFWTPVGTDGITNDIDGLKLKFGARYADDQHLYTVITSDDLDELQARLPNADVKFPEKKAELLKLLHTMKYEDNPILVFYKLKN